jgi:glutaredoxin 3
MRIKVYSTPTCPYCNMTKAFLDEKGVTYDDFDVSADVDARSEMVKRSGQMGVPVIDVGGEVIIGFDQQRIASLLEEGHNREA